MAGLYIHVPFCRQACHYCDFHFSTSRENFDSMIHALCNELEIQKNYLEKEPLETIYFGGGTPSLLSKHQLQILLDTIHRNFSTSEVEITLEANPDDLNQENLILLKQAGVNRLSIGIQSFDDNVLKFLNRAHSSREALTCLDQARKVGFDNISIDLMYAIPGQDDDLWKKNMEKVIEFSPEHISAYSLTIEEKTVFGNWQKKGKFLSESEDIAASQMETLMKQIGDAGYEQYEISNFCKLGFYSRHNSSYWQQKKYLGIGPSAHSYNGESRQFNVANNPLYIQSINQGKVPFQLEILSRENKINEYLFTRLRTKWGCDLNYLQSRHDYDLLQENHQKIATLLSQGFIQINNNILLLTQKAKLVADRIASDLFVTI
jgi:oxygen-independent coproporphyrinogen III oxidase